jgi:hypothetical protein
VRRRSVPAQLCMPAFLAYFMLPLFWLVLGCRPA